MASVFVCMNTSFSVATGGKTALNVIAGANQPVQIMEWGVSFDGVTSSAVPATVELCQSTQATAGTGGASAPAVVQVRGRALTTQFTSAHNYTAEPTALTVIEQVFVPQYNGIYVRSYGPNEGPDTDLSGGTVKALAIRIKSSATVNALVYARVVLDS